jgi:hypothetical protein
LSSREQACAIILVRLSTAKNSYKVVQTKLRSMKDASNIKIIIQEASQSVHISAFGHLIIFLVTNEILLELY